MPITIDFKGKLVLVTGGGRGIGLAITTALAKGESGSIRYQMLEGLTPSTGGADVAISYTAKDSTPVAAELSKAYNVRVTAYRCAVTSSADVNQMLVDVEKAYGKKVDIGVANAGG